jgi:Ca2+-binding EF-hand superfamily protein
MRSGHAPQGVTQMKHTHMIAMALVAALLASPGLVAAGGERAEQFRQKMDERLQAMDTDGDGAISREEYLTQAEQRFARLDLNGDGLISAEEREQIRTQVRERRVEQFP